MQVGERLGRYEVEKRCAVEREDYDLAKHKKRQMEQYRGRVYAQLELHSLVDAELVGSVRPGTGPLRSGGSCATQVTLTLRALAGLTLEQQEREAAPGTSLASVPSWGRVTCRSPAPCASGSCGRRTSVAVAGCEHDPWEALPVPRPTRAVCAPTVQIRRPRPAVTGGAVSADCSRTVRAPSRLHHSNCLTVIDKLLSLSVPQFPCHVYQRGGEH